MEGQGYMAKLGIDRKPAVVHVQTMERATEITALCDEYGWKVIVGVEPDKPEDISDVEKLLNSNMLKATKIKIGRNEPCPCGSGKKYKKCCMLVQNIDISRKTKQNDDFIPVDAVAD